MAKALALITRKLPDAAEAHLTAATTTFDAIAAAVSVHLYTAALRAEMPRVKMLAKVGFGFNSTDIETAKAVLI